MTGTVRNKEVSWLGFNARLLQEAADPTVPLLERLKFLGIYSSNLDEFFRIRVATLKRIAKLGSQAKKIIGDEPKKVLSEIRETVISERRTFDRVYAGILEALELRGVQLVDERTLRPEHEAFARNYFSRVVRPRLMPIMIDQVDELPELRDHGIYLAVELRARRKSTKTLHALLEVPNGVLPRFVELPSIEGRHFIMLLDDMIRFSLRELFAFFDVEEADAYTLEMTRDAELDIDDDLSESLVRKLAKSLKRRRAGEPVRLIYDDTIPEDLLEVARSKLGLDGGDVELIAGGRYHNFKDFMNFPPVGPRSLVYEALPALPHPALIGGSSILRTIRDKDVLLTYPYHSFDHIIDLLREASIDPKVTTIKMTLYRVAKDSSIVSALINAAKNGKDVTAVLELQARFDEEANIRWSDELQEEGVTVIHGSPGLKVHSKLLLIERARKKQTDLYACVGTGNFNETTAGLYGDHALLTANRDIALEVEHVFEFLENGFIQTDFSHLMVSPFDTREKLTALIDREIKNAKRGKPAYMIVKLNNVTDLKMIEKLLEASEAGVDVRMMVRGMFSLVPKNGTPRARGIVDRFLEHTRLLVFCNGGDERYFLSSADWMPRNLDRRVEVTCPIHDPELQQELRHFLETQWADNVKNRVLDGTNDNERHIDPTRSAVRAQISLYDHFERAAGRPRTPLRKADPAPEPAQRREDESGARLAAK